VSVISTQSSKTIHHGDTESRRRSKAADEGVRRTWTGSGSRRDHGENALTRAGKWRLGRGPFGSAQGRLFDCVIVRVADDHFGQDDRRAKSRTLHPLGAGQIRVFANVWVLAAPLHPRIRTISLGQMVRVVSCVVGV
jgi:hypothetical protein